MRDDKIGIGSAKTCNVLNANSYRLIVSMITYIYVFSEKYLSELEMCFISDCKELIDCNCNWQEV